MGLLGSLEKSVQRQRGPGRREMDSLLEELKAKQVPHSHQVNQSDMVKHSQALSSLNLSQVDSSSKMGCLLWSGNSFCHETVPGIY